MGQRRDNQGRFARRFFAPAAPTATPGAGRPTTKPSSKKTPAAKLKYDPRVDAARLEQALNPNLSWFARRTLRKDLERQFGKIDWTDVTAVADEAGEDHPSEAVALPVVTHDRLPGATTDTLRAFSGMTGNLWLRVAETGVEQFRKVAEQARVEVRPPADPTVEESDAGFAHIEHVVVFYGPISERHLAGNILFYPNSTDR